MMTHKKRPAVDWIRWARKPFLFIFYSLGAVIFAGLEKLEALLAGRSVPRQPGSVADRLTITFTAGAGSHDLILPFVPLFEEDAKWIKLRPDSVFADLRRDSASLSLKSHIYGKGIPEGPYRVASIAALAPQKEMAEFFTLLRDAGLAIGISSVLATRRSAVVPHAKGVLRRMAVGSRNLELSPAHGGERLMGEGAAAAIEFMRGGGDYHHLFIAGSMTEPEKCPGLVERLRDLGVSISAYACLLIARMELVPIFLLERSSDESRMEDSALLLIWREAPAA